MNPQEYDVLERLRTENAQLHADKSELRKMLELMYENIELRNALEEKEGKVQGIPVPRRGRSKERGNKDSVTPSCQESKQVQHFQRVVGETAFQLDRRIIGRIFEQYGRLYGFFVPNITEKILQITSCPVTSKVDEAERSKLFERKRKLFNYLKQFGYDKHVHPTFTAYLVNTYGVLKDCPQSRTVQLANYNCPEELRRMAAESMPCSILENVNIIIDCLKCLAEEDGKPFFIS